MSSATPFKEGSSYNLLEHCYVEHLDSNFEIKQWWMFNEWDGANPSWKEMIQKVFPNRDDLHPSNPSPQAERIKRLFHHMRGKEDYGIWGSLKEKGKWTKVSVEKLDPEWIINNVEVVYPSIHRKCNTITELSCLVLWEAPNKSKYRLIEGNHRVSAWLNLKSDGSRHNDEPLPKAIPCMFYIGKP